MIVLDFYIPNDDCNRIELDSHNEEAVQNSALAYRLSRSPHSLLAHFLLAHFPHMLLKLVSLHTMIEELVK